MKLKKIIKEIIFSYFCDKKSNVSKLYETEFTIKPDDCEFIYSTGTVIKFNYNGLKYFRECRKIEKADNYKVFIIKSIKFFFFEIIKFKNALEICNDICQDIADSKNYNKLFKISDVYALHFDNIVSNIFCDFDLLGIPSVNKYDLVEHRTHFLQFLRDIVFEIQHNRFKKNNSFSCVGLNRVCATYNFAKLMGIERLIPFSQIGKVYFGEHVLYGTVMNNGGDCSPAYMPLNDRKNFDCNFIKDISCLEFFDYLCYQLDHRLDNYNILLKEGRIHSVCAFDNDARKTFFISPFLPKKTTWAKCSAVIKKGYINRPYIDKKFFESIVNIRFDLLKKNLKNFLTKAQIVCLFMRIKQFKKASLKTAQKHKEFVVENWENVDYKKELSENYGLTYFNLYLNDSSLLDRIEKLGG